MPKVPTRPSGGKPPTDEPDFSGVPPVTAAIRAGVIDALGRPPELFRVAVVPLWPGYYRVNLLTGPNVTDTRIPHSYFVEATADGAIVSTMPPIVRLYP